MTQIYSFTQEIELEIKDNLDKMIDKLISKNESLIQFNYLTDEFIKNKFEMFNNEFKLNHNEIRQKIKKVRHFILRKKDKLKKELDNPLFLSNILDMLDDNDKKIVWEFLHLNFLLYENYHINKNELIINTLIDELNKNKEEPINSDNLENKMKEFMNNLTSSNPEAGLGSGIENITNMFKNLTENNGEEPDIQKMLKGLIPNMGENENGELTKEIISDIKESLLKTSNVDEIFNSTKKLGEKYQGMITSGEINTTEILSSLIGLIDNTELKNELSNIDITNMPKPEEMLNKLVGDMPENFNLGTMLSALSQGQMQGGNDNSNNNTKDMVLTDNQIKEMEEYYEKLKISN